MTDPSAPTRPCPQCGAEWPDEIRYCGECGGRMPDATVVASPFGVQVEASAAPMAFKAEAPTVMTRPVERPAISVVDPSKIVNIAPATPLLEPPDPHTIETRRDVDVDAIAEAWSIVRHRRGPLALGTLIAALATSALSSTGIGVLALGPLHGGLAVVGLRAASGRRVELNDFFEGFAKGLWLRLAVAYLLVGVLVALASVLLIVPGLYLAMGAMYTPFLVVDRNEDAWGAFKISMNGVHAQLGAHVAVFASLLALNFVGALCCGIGLLVTIPLTATAVGVCYGRVFGFAFQR